MADLRELLSVIKNMQTYIQIGNIVFNSDNNELFPSKRNDNISQPDILSQKIKEECINELINLNSLSLYRLKK